MNGFLPRITLSLFAALTLSASAFGQSPGAQQAYSAAYDLFQAQDYKGAAAGYEKLLKDFPTDSLVGPVQIQLAYAQFFTAQYDPALATLDKFLKGPAPAPELKQLAMNLVPQVLSSKAASMSASDPKRKATYEEAVRKFTEFLTAFPTSPDAEAATYGRALANFQLGKYDEAAKDLEANLKTYASSGTISDSQNLYALTLATQGSLELMKGATGDKAAAFAKYDQATQLLKDIIAKRSDLTLVNAANLQLGEILSNRAANSPDAERPAILQQALASLRAVQPRETLIALQKQRLAAFPVKRREALQRGDQNAVKQLDKDQLRESGKLAELEGRPDQTLQALLKSGEIFVSLNRFDEGRTLYRHLQPFLENPDDQKRALYYIAVTYALQNVADKAVPSYDSFQSKYKGDPIAQNLPAAMGTMFLNTPDPAVNSPQKAATYFQESLAIYPNGAFAGLSVVSAASAQTRLKEYAQALKTFQDYLAKNPPADVGVIAQKGLADVYKDTGKWDEAIAAYKTLLSKYPTYEAAGTEAQYWIAICTQQKGDNAGAIPLLKDFVTKYGSSPFAPNALYTLAIAQVGTKATDDALATLTEVATKFPDSQPAPFSYFLRAQLLAQAGRGPEVIGVLKDFIAKYPQDPKVYFAYDSLAKSAIAAKTPDDAVTLYVEFATKYPQDARAADALQKIAEIQRVKATDMGRYGALTPEEQTAWKKSIDDSVATTEGLIQKYPESPELALALGGLMESQQLLVAASLKTPQQLGDYFQQLAAAQSSAGAKSKILFAYAASLEESDPKLALTKMQEAYNPQVVYAPKDMDLFGLALLDNGKVDDAAAVFAKVGTDYPLPPQGAAQASPQVQEAQAILLFGQGRVAQTRGQSADAAKFFQQLSTLYPWSPKILEANYGIAESQRKTAPDEALASLGKIIRAQNASAELRAKSMLLFGFIYKDKASTDTDPKAKDEAMASAIDNFIKIAQFYSGVPSVAAEGLWEGGQLLEQQASASADPKVKARQIDQAKRAYKDLVTNYSSSPFAEKASARLAALGGS